MRAFAMRCCLGALLLLCSGLFSASSAPFVIHAAAASRTSAGSLLYLQLLTTINEAGHTTSVRARLWTNPARALAHLSIAPSGYGGLSTEIYYARDAHGQWWETIKEVSTRHPVRLAIAATAAPAMMTYQALQSLFAPLVARATPSNLVGLHNRMAIMIDVTSLLWPFHYEGTARLWLNYVTGLPVQFRYQVGTPAHPVMAIAVVEKLNVLPARTAGVPSLLPDGG